MGKAESSSGRPTAENILFQHLTQTDIIFIAIAVNVSLQMYMFADSSYCNIIFPVEICFRPNSMWMISSICILTDTYEYNPAGFNEPRIP